MLTIRPASARGHTEIGWLDSRHSFAFGDYRDPDAMGFRALRVINDDRVRGGAGFPPHPHRDMEIVSYVLEGALEHRDDMGNGSVIRPGDVQRMSAGTGVVHAEWNHSKTEPAHFLQIWILPERRGLPPGYEQKRFDLDQSRGRLVLVASRNGREGSVTIHQDAAIWAARLDPDQAVTHELGPGRHAWLHLARGAVRLGSHPLKTGDGAALTREPRLTLHATEPTELLLFDLA